LGAFPPLSVAPLNSGARCSTKAGDFSKALPRVLNSRTAAIERSIRRCWFDARDYLPNVDRRFVWTGFDYLGEPTPCGSRKDWPSRGSYSGIVDLAGYPKVC